MNGITLIVFPPKCCDFKIFKHNSFSTLVKHVLTLKLNTNIAQEGDKEAIYFNPFNLKFIGWAWAS